MKSSMAKKIIEFIINDEDDPESYHGNDPPDQMCHRRLSSYSHHIKLVVITW